MGYAIQQNQTAYPLIFGPIVLTSDHITSATGKSLTVNIYKPGGAFASPAGAVTEIGDGFYQIAGNATDSNTLGPLLLYVTCSGCDPFNDTFMVAPNPALAADLTVNVAQIAGQTANAAGAVTFPGNIGTSTLTQAQVTGGAYPLDTDGSGNVTVGGYKSGEDPATLVLGATASSWNTAGTIGHDINASGTASDPWTTSLPGSYTAGQAGYIIGNTIENALKSAGATAPSWWSAAPTAASIAALILATPANLLTTDASGRVTLTPSEHTNIKSDVTTAVTAMEPIAATISQNVTVGAIASGVVSPAGFLNATDIGSIWTATISVGTPGQAQYVLYAAAADPWATLLIHESVAGSFGLTLKNFMAASPSGWMAGDTASLAAITSEFDSASVTIAELLSVVGKNNGVRNTVYSGTNLMSYDLCMYDTSAHATTNDGATGLVHKYSVVNTYDGSNNLLTSVTTKVS